MNQCAIDDYVNGLSCSCISDKYRISRNTLRKYFQINNIRPIDISATVASMYNNGMSITEISKTYHKGETSIRNMLLDKGVKIRTPKEYSKMKWVNPTQAMIDKYKTCTRGLNTEESKKKRDIYFSSDVHKSKARAQAIKAWNNPEYRKKMVAVKLRTPLSSSQQEILYSILTDLSIKFYKDTDQECKIGFYVFDCRVDPQPGIKIDNTLLIEVQGDYWHNLPRSVNNDKSKSTYVKTYFPQYDLKYLWEHEFIAKDRIAEVVKYWLGLNAPSMLTTDFKKISEREITFKEAEIFLGKYHYASRIRSGACIGYFIDGILIAVCTYSIPVRQETAKKQGLLFSEVLELSRFAIHPQYQVKNLASHVISRSINFIRNAKPNVKLLISFADTTYNHLGTIYKASNWLSDGETAPDYWYIDNLGHACHKKTLWDKASKMKMTETEYANKYGYNKIWGGKKFRYIYRLR